MDRFYHQLHDLLQAGESVAVATVVATRGSTPREVGAKMIVRRSGATVGTVGGGCGEAQVWRTALQVLDTGASQGISVDLTEEVHLEAAGACGGTMELWVEPWLGEVESPDARVARLLAESQGRRQSVVLATVAAGSGSSCPSARRAVVSTEAVLLSGLGPVLPEGWLLREAAAALELEGGRFATYEAAAQGPHDELATVRLWLEPVKPPPRLMVLGAGHIALPLVAMGRLLGFQVAVLDDRAAFANRERFPEADIVLAADFGDGIRRLGVDRDSYVVLVTRGHRHDVECLRQLVGRESAYLGMIGSRRRVKGVFDLLQREGAPVEGLRRLHAPIGLDLGARTPAEIALSIVAEIVKVRRGGRAQSLSDRGTRQ